MSTKSKGRGRLAIRYFDDRVLLTDTARVGVLPAAVRVVRVHHARRARGARHQRHRRPGRDQDAGRRGPPADRAPALPGGGVGDGLDATRDGGPGWHEYLEEMYQHVWAKDFWSKEIYLGVRLGQRSMRAQLGDGVLGAASSSIYRAAEKALGLEDDARAPAARSASGPTRRSGSAGRSPPPRSVARHATSREVAWLFRHTLTGSLGDPPPSATRRRTWGAGEIEPLVRGRRSTTAARCCGSSSRPGRLVGGVPVVRPLPRPHGVPRRRAVAALRRLAAVPGRGLVADAADPAGQGVSKDVSRRLAHARDMDAHIREAGAEAPIALAEQIDAARMLEHGITKERLPFVYGWHRLIVTAPTEELCVQPGRGGHRALPRHRHRPGQLHRRPVLAVLSSRCRGRRCGVNAYVQRQPLYTIAGGMPTATVDLGDRMAEGNAGWIGPYIGETLGRARSVVHFDPLLAAARNRPTAVAITGEPGGGKTTLAHAADLPAGAARRDDRGHRPEGRRRVAGGVPGKTGRKARVLPLSSAAAGLLDPFSFGDDLAAKRTMATETLRLLLPRMSEERESAMIQAVGAVASASRALAWARSSTHAGGVRRPGVEEPGRGAALDVRDAPGPAVLRAVRRTSRSTPRAGRRSSPSAG